jgi:hypothetical protein
MNFRVELPATPDSPEQIAEQLIALARRLSITLGYTSTHGNLMSGGLHIGVVLDVNGTDMIAYPNNSVGQVMKLWENCKPREPVAEAAPYNGTYHRAVSLVRHLRTKAEFSPYFIKSEWVELEVAIGALYTERSRGEASRTPPAPPRRP